jgi:hypothetical protein
MGEIIRFPDEVSPRGGKYVDANTEPATVIILPVIRIDRDPDGSNGLEPGNNPGRRRRRRIAR